MSGSPERHGGTGSLLRFSDPAARLRQGPVGHGAVSAGSPTWALGRSRRSSAGHHREGRGGVHILMEAELFTVQADLLIDVDDAADADRRHLGSLLLQARPDGRTR